MSEEKQPLLLNSDSNDQPQQTSLVAKLKAQAGKLLEKGTLTILIYVVLYITCGVINSVLLKSVMNTFQNYGFFLNQLTNYGYIPIFGSVVAYKVFFTNDIPKETKEFPLYKFAVMGALDALCGYFVVLGGISTSGPLQQLLNQAIIPFTMITSFIFLKERFSIYQMLGALVIVGGVVISLVPSLTGSGNTGNKVFWNMFYLFSIVPYAASNVYKDIGFKSVDDMDVWWLQFWDGVFQSLIGTLLFPVNAILPPPATVPFKSVIPSLKNGTICLTGHDIWTQANSDCTLTQEANSNLVCDECTNAWVILLCYMTINVIYNIFILLVIKHAGATVFSIANTLRLPLTNIVFSLKFIMHKNTSPFSPLSVAGLIVILIGLGGYRAASILKNRRAQAGGAQIKFIPGMGPAGVDGVMPFKKEVIIPKTTDAIRTQFIAKLGIQIPESRINKAQINDA
ncbi:putative transmembrane protein [Tieghemostelium lacteum]|uniref:Putative transmembrane protein n=1 Tax=Tieghemostelium lacteum TaxID=361077 RepID=A0A151Z983_TIELA|nr:putative transmembrane protein [Tieghemostelium lacteum]|eukprot:KYQ90502.1 putative transmembrane protein [Tieghemostelium lacteum]